MMKNQGKGGIDPLFRMTDESIPSAHMRYFGVCRLPGENHLVSSEKIDDRLLRILF